MQGDASSLADLDRLYETVKREKGKIDILFASAGSGEFAKLEEVTEEHFDKTFDLNVRGTLFTVQKALPLFNDNGSIFLNGSIASIKGFPARGDMRESCAGSHPSRRVVERGLLNVLRFRLGPCATRSMAYALGQRRH